MTAVAPLAKSSSRPLHPRGRPHMRVGPFTTARRYTYTLGGEQRVAIVSESGLYQLILSSRKPQAKAFRRWVTETVLPSIRKTGGHQTKDHARTPGPDGDGRQNAPTIVLPGPGRYVATVVPDGAVHVHKTEYSALLEELTLADCRILCHTLRLIEGQWHKYQHRRSVASDRRRVRLGGT